jgi:signal transduction histidine kinase/ActR/RegA family two-component response regulator
MELKTALRRLNRAEQKVQALEELIESRSREIFLARMRVQAVDRQLGADDGPSEDPDRDLARSLRDLELRVAEQQRADVRNRLLVAVSQALATALNLDHAIAGALAVLGEHLGWDLGFVWGQEEGGATLGAKWSWSAREHLPPGFARTTWELRLQPGVGLPGRVWSERRSAWIEHLANDGNFPRQVAAATEGLISGAAFPVLLDDAPLLVFEFYARTVRAPDPFDLALLNFIGAQIGLVLERFRTTEELKQNNVALAKARDEAVAAARAKADFLAMMSHEIRTPMSGLLGMLGLLWDGPLEAEQRTFLQVALGSGRSLLGILNDILDLSKIDAGRLRLEVVPFSPHELCLELLELHRPLAAEKGLVLSGRLDLPADVLFTGDPTRVRQILTNFLTNALKFTERGAVELSLRSEPEGVHLQVRDTGPGIPLDVQPLLFEPFTQGDVSTTRIHGGTGLGLAICRRLVDQMGGAIGFRSEAGQGTVFWLRLPLVQAHGAARRLVVDAAAVDGLLRGRRVLLAEDNPVNQRVAQHILERLGCQVEIAPNGRVALEAIARSRPDFVLMDCRMPELDGYQTCRALRAIEGADGPRLPVLALTANAFEDDRRQCMDAGMDAFLTKPFSRQELIAALGPLLGAAHGSGSSD